MKTSLSRAELHRRFAEELEREAPPGSIFVFEIEPKEGGADGRDWYPLAAMGSWRGEVMANLAAFRAVRERLSALYELDTAESPGGAPVEA